MERSHSSGAHNTTFNAHFEVDKVLLFTKNLSQVITFLGLLVSVNIFRDNS